MIGSVSSPSRAPPISRDALQSLEGLPARFLLMVSTSSDRCVKPKPCNSSSYGVWNDKGFNHWNWELKTEDSPGGRLASANFVIPNIAILFTQVAMGSSNLSQKSINSLWDGVRHLMMEDSKWHNKAKQNKNAFYIPASLDPQTSQNWTTKLPGTSGCAEVWRFGKDDNLTIKKNPIGDEESRWNSWSNQIWGRFLLKKPAFCQFIAEICDKIFRPLIQKPLKSEETETCQMLLDNGGIIWMPEKISQMSNPNGYWPLCRYVDFKIT